MYFSNNEQTKLHVPITKAAEHDTKENQTIAINTDAVATIFDNQANKWKFTAMSMHRFAYPLCENKSGINYDWINTRAGKDILVSFMKTNLAKAAAFCAKNKGRLLEPKDSYDRADVATFMSKIGVNQIWIGLQPKHSPRLD